MGMIGSLAFGLAMGLCPVSYLVMKKIGVRKTCLIGAFLWLIGLVASSFVNNVYLLLITYSVLLGVGTNFCFNPSMILVGSHFTQRNQAIASCLATAGISIGNLSINPLMGYLLENYGWRLTFRIMCGFVVTTMFISIALYRKPDSQKLNDVELQACEANKGEEKRAKLSTPKMLFNPGVTLWMIATLLWSVSFIFPLIFLVKYVKTTFGASTSQANVIMLVFGIFELIGRFVGGTSAERSRINLTYIYAIFTTLAGIVTIATVPINNFQWMYFYGICCGITSGVANSMIYVTTHKLFGSFYGNRIWTYVNVMVALGAAGGPTLAGVLFDATKSYILPFNIAGSVFIASGVVMVATKVAVDKHPLK